MLKSTTSSNQKAKTLLFYLPVWPSLARQPFHSSNESNASLLTSQFFGNVLAHFLGRIALATNRFKSRYSFFSKYKSWLVSKPENFQLMTVSSSLLFRPNSRTYSEWNVFIKLLFNRAFSGCLHDRFLLRRLGERGIFFRLPPPHLQKTY